MCSIYLYGYIVKRVCGVHFLKTYCFFLQNKVYHVCIEESFDTAFNMDYGWWWNQTDQLPPSSLLYQNNTGLRGLDGKYCFPKYVNTFT